MSTAYYGFSLHVTVYVAPEDHNDFLAAFKSAYDVVAAEPECTYFEVFYKQDEPGVFRWVENWNQTKDWFMQHQVTKEYYKPYFAKTEPMYIKPRDVQFYERLKPGDWTRCKGENFGS